MKKPTLDFKDWGRIEYSSAWEKQRLLLKKRVDGEIPDTFIFCEHDPVITLGRGCKRNPVFVPDSIASFEVERGGLATYHGPGQIVVYPIISLSSKESSLFPGGLHAYIRFLEQWSIDVLTKFGIQGLRKQGHSGVWLDNGKKLASIGVAVKHWVTMHGLALNWQTDATAWQGFNPCGFASEVMTDVATESGKILSHKELVALFIEQFPQSLLKFQTPSRNTETYDSASVQS